MRAEIELALCLRAGTFASGALARDLVFPAVERLSVPVGGLAHEPLHAGRELTRSVYMADDRGTAGAIHLVRSPWDPGPGGHLQPESQPVDAKMLAAKRRDVEDAISSAEKLRALTDKLLRDSHAKRSRPGFDRRRR